MTASPPDTPASAQAAAAGAPRRRWRDAAFGRTAGRLGQIAADLHGRGWTPATSSNFSFRVSRLHCAVTASGRDKARIGPGDLLIMDLDGAILDAPRGRRPSAETGLHTALYRRDPDIGAVLHTHAPRSVLASMLLDRNGEVVLEDYELLKAFPGIDSHAATLRLPVLPNDQDIDALAAAVDARLDAQGAAPCWAYLIAGHGVYAWGEDLDAAARHLEALDYLLGLELDHLHLTGRTRDRREETRA